MLNYCKQRFTKKCKIYSILNLLYKYFYFFCLNALLFRFQEEFVLFRKTDFFCSFLIFLKETKNSSVCFLEKLICKVANRLEVPTIYIHGQFSFLCVLMKRKKRNECRLLCNMCFSWQTFS